MTDQPEVLPWMEEAANEINDTAYMEYEENQVTRLSNREVAAIIAAHAPYPQHYSSHIPTPERVAEAHTSMTQKGLLETGRNGQPIGHRVYKQASEEGCYICALLMEIDKLREQKPEPSVPVSVLRKYGEHIGNCCGDQFTREIDAEGNAEMYACTCGLNDAIHAAEKEQK